MGHETQRARRGTLRDCRCGEAACSCQSARASCRFQECSAIHDNCPVLFAAVPIQCRLGTPEAAHAPAQAVAHEPSHLNNFARPKKMAAS